MVPSEANRLPTCAAYEPEEAWLEERAAGAQGATLGLYEAA